MTYLITFSCYGRHLHGHESGSVDRNHNQAGSRLIDADPDRVLLEEERSDQAPYSLDQMRRGVVLEGVLGRRSENHWTLLAAHVRTTHVHLVVEAEVRPERIMNDLKSYASRCLNRSGLDEAGRRRWARHGSTRWLWHWPDISAAIRYVVDEQGGPMAVFEAAP